MEKASERLVTVADAVESSPTATAKCGVIGSGVETVSGEPPVPPLKGVASQVFAAGSFGVETRAVGESISESLEQVGGEVVPSVAAGGAEAALVSVPMADAAEEIGSQQALEGGGKAAEATTDGVATQKVSVYAVPHYYC